jgi:hypothetical protein
MLAGREKDLVVADGRRGFLVPMAGGRVPASYRHRRTGAKPFGRAGVIGEKHGPRVHPNSGGNNDAHWNFAPDAVSPPSGRACRRGGQ